MVSDDTPQVNQLLTVSALGITDADNAGGGLGNRAVGYIWQYEPDPTNQPGVFVDIVGASAATVRRRPTATASA